MLLGRKAIGTVAYLGGLPALLEAFTWSWGQMVQYNEEFLASPTGYVHYAKSTFTDHAPARNGLVAKFLGDWLVQLDTDHQFEPDLVGRLLRTADDYQLDVLTGVYQLKNPPHVPVLYQFVDIGGKEGLQPMARWPQEARVLQIGSAGGGCLFVRRSVFDKIAEHFKCGAFDKIKGYSEDHSFFCRCRELEIKAYVATKVESNHLRVAPVTMDDLDDSQLKVGELFQVGGFP